MYRENAWLKYDQKELKNVMEFADGYKEFLSISKTERLATKEAVKQLEAYAFDFLHLRVLYAVIATNNLPCSALYRSAGYQPSSVLPHWTLESDAVIWIKNQ